MFQLTFPIGGAEVWWPGLTFLGLFIGFLTGMFGVGGGFLLTPFLNIFFGVPYPVAVGSGLAQIFVTGAASTWKHWQKRNIDPLMGIIMAGGALGGTEIGVRLLKMLKFSGLCTINGHSVILQDLLMNCFFLILMLFVVVQILKESASNGSEEVTSTIADKLQKYQIQPMIAFPKSHIASLSLWIPLLCSFIVGILTGLLGVGGGFITFPLLVYIIGVPTIIAVGTSAFQILFATGYGALRHASLGHVVLPLVAFMLIGSLIGVQLGVYVTKFIGGHKIRRYFAYVIGLGILVIFWDVFQKIV